MSVTGGGAGLTHQSVALKLTDHGSPCLLRGWPHLIGLSRTARVAAGRTRFSAALTTESTRPTALTLAQSRPIYVLLDGSDSEVRKDAACPSSYTSFDIELPHHRGQVRAVEARVQLRELTMCGPFLRTPYVPARRVIAKQRG